LLFQLNATDEIFKKGIRVQPLPSPDTSHVSPAEVWSRRWAESNMPYQFYAELARAQLPALTRPGLAVHKKGEEEEDDDLPSDAEASRRQKVSSKGVLNAVRTERKAGLFRHGQPLAYSVGSQLRQNRNSTMTFGIW
jgi:hypothetical protein